MMRSEGAKSPVIRKGVLTIHIVASVGALGAELAILVLSLAGLNGVDAPLVYPAMSLIGAWLLTPLAVMSLGTGLILAWVTRWGLFMYWWVAIKFAINASLTGLVLVALTPRLGALATAIETGKQLAANERQQLVIAPLVGSTLLVVALALAVFKPSWRLRSSRRADERVEVRPTSSAGQ